MQADRSGRTAGDEPSASDAGAGAVTATPVPVGAAGRSFAQAVPADITTQAMTKDNLFMLHLLGGTICCKDEFTIRYSMFIPLAV